MLTPIFLPTPHGRLYLSLYQPPDDSAPRGWVLHLPAFAEEMNKSRPMVTRQARLLAASGFCVVVPDLYGTGDSDGEFVNADWQRWTGDVEQILAWIKEHGGDKVQLWGLRLGCIMALEVAGSNPQLIAQLVLWQPVITGKQCVNQFLRLRMAAGLMDGSKESTTELRGMLAGGSSLEVAGYDLAPALVTQLDALDAANMPPPGGIKITWLEVAAAEGRPLAPASRKLIDLWQGQGVEVVSRVVPGDQFWATQEIAFAPRLLSATTQVFEELPVSPATPPPLSIPAGNERDQDSRALLFDCNGEQLLGMLHPGLCAATTAVLLVVGGPQYRVGSHRQFVHLARALGGAGIPVLRFDYRGMGDSAGELLGFENIEQDIRAAVDALLAELPAVRQVVIWGLCDAASAASFYAPTDERVAGLVLVNPWVRSEAGEARTYLKHYYWQRLASGAFWKGLVSGKVSLGAALASLKDNLVKAFQGPGAAVESRGPAQAGLPARHKANLVERLYTGFSSFKGPILLIISGRDLTAAEFMDASQAHRGFRRLLADTRITRRELVPADHTFSQAVWRNQVANWTIEWIKGL